MKKVVNKIPCEFYYSLLVQDTELDVEFIGIQYDYVSVLDRGGLKYLSMLTVLLAYRVLCIMQVLISAKYERLFLHYENQRNLLTALSIGFVESDVYFLLETSEICAQCSLKQMRVLMAILPHFVNIFINNYSNNCNDAVHEKGTNSRRSVSLKR